MRQYKNKSQKLLENYNKLTIKWLIIKLALKGKIAILKELRYHQMKI